VTCGADVIYDEVAFLGAHYHWALNEVLDLEHATRRRFIRAVDELGLDR
jgi:hypothetical protein